MGLLQVVYTNNQGWREVRKVPSGTPEREYGTGILVGPPDLSDIGEDAKDINNLLVDHGMITFKDFDVKRAYLLRLLQERLGMNEQKAREMRNSILSIYQQDYYREEE